MPLFGISPLPQPYPPEVFFTAFSSSGRRDFAPYTTPAQSHHPLRGFVGNWRTCEFRFIQELCPMEPVKLPKFTSGRRDLNPGPPKATHLADLGLFNRKKLSPHCPETNSLRQSGTMGFVGDWWGTAV